MNILLTLNTYFVKYAQVMLVSLFENNPGEHFEVYVLCNEMTDEAKRELEEFVKEQGNDISYLYADDTLFKDFPTTELLTVELLFICLAHLLLPQDMERILYLDADVVVDGAIRELYDMDFEGKYLIACGQSFEKIDGHYYRIGARPEKGQQFNCGVMLFQLEAMRRNISLQDFVVAAEGNAYRFSLVNQELFNIVYENKARILNSYQYNFRISLLENHLRNGNVMPVDSPVIYHYVNRDYYRLGVISKPWKLTLTEEESDALYQVGVTTRPYDIREADKFNLWMQQHWWDYAKKTKYYADMKTEMDAEKQRLLSQFFEDGDIHQVGERAAKQRALKIKFEKITANDFSRFDDSLTYGELERYIDELDADTAIQTMQNLFAHNCSRLRESKKPIRVAFLVYSSAEWQCEGIYRLMEQDDAFDPWITVCAYGHGTDETIRNTYIDTCSYFRRARTYHHIEYLGYCNRCIPENRLDRYDLIFYISPYTNLLPQDVNILSRKIFQMAVHIPYGIMIANRREARYSDYLPDQPIMKLSWKYFCASNVELEIARNTARLQGYNVILSGYPKIDTLIDGTFSVRKQLWKKRIRQAKRVIWAPHFNMEKGMNGTFHMNYKWFYEYARDHAETSWIVRPHPRMDVGILENNVFQSLSEYKEYLEKWDELENAKVIAQGDYYDFFATSDAMILDSMSFLSEYQYTGKPILFLEQETCRPLNNLGQALVDAAYTAKGDDFLSIEHFIEKDMVQDERKEAREKLFKEWLDIRKYTKVGASSYITNNIKGALQGERDESFR